MADASQINSIASIDAGSILGRKIGIGNLTEMDVVKNAIRLARIKQVGNRTLEMPGLTRNKDFVIKAVAEFKDEVANNKPINLASKVTNNDIGIESLDRPQVFGLTTFKQTGLTSPGDINVIPTGTSTFDLTEDDERIIITDIIEVDPTAGAHAVKIIDDGDSNRGPESMGLDMRIEDSVRIKELDQPRIIDKSLDMNVRLVSGSTLEIIPVGLHVFKGSAQDAL